MAGIYLTWLAQVLRDAGVKVVEVSGWQTRGRSSGGFPSTPLGVQWHHTASSGSNPTNDINYMVYNSSAKPVGNIYLARDGTAHVMAAGAANTAGKGGPTPLSRGTVPLDQGNTRTVAIEAANNGIGQDWPQVQIDAYFKVSNAINKKLGNQPGDLFTHHHYTPTRKIDPATTTGVKGPWVPSSVSTSRTWSNTDVRNEASKRAGVAPPPAPTRPPPATTPPPTSTEGMERMLIMKYGGTPTANWGGWYSFDGGVTRRAVASMAHAGTLVDLGALDAKTFKRVTDRAWNGVSHTTSQTELDKYLTPYG